MGYITQTKMAHQLLSLTLHFECSDWSSKGDNEFDLYFKWSDWSPFLSKTHHGQQLMSHLGLCYIIHTAVTTIIKYGIQLIILGDGGYGGAGYITLTKMAHLDLSIECSDWSPKGDNEFDLYFK